MMTTHSDAPANALALALFTRRFSTLTASGVKMSCCLAILEADCPPPLSEASRELFATVAQENKPLSEAMRKLPALFSPFYINMIRVGEIGGVLDETLRYLAEFLEEGWKLWRLTGAQNEWLSFAIPSDLPPSRDWADMTPLRRKMIVAMFCRSYSTLLMSGVPIETATEVVADLLPARQRDELKAIAQAGFKEGLAAPLERMGFLPELVIGLIALGEECRKHGKQDILEALLAKAADNYEHELHCELAPGA